uniref:Uncharacterized protein n=1 Tax=Fagus sylvatica TaxID=28930 RepID=A0A2N9EGE4_FAGSY
MWVPDNTIFNSFLSPFKICLLSVDLAPFLAPTNGAIPCSQTTPASAPTSGADLVALQMGLAMGLVEIFYGFDGEIVVDLQMFCGFDVEIMGICRCDADLMGLMALQMGGWGMGFVGLMALQR